MYRLPVAALGRFSRGNPDRDYPGGAGVPKEYMQALQSGNGAHTAAPPVEWPVYDAYRR